MLGIQEKLKNIGLSGCYFLSLIHGAESHVVDLYDECLRRGFIEQDCYVNDPCGILSLVGVKATECIKSPTITGNPVLIVVHYVKGCSSHFVRIDYDPANVNLSDWQIKDYRLFYL